MYVTFSLLQAIFKNNEKVMKQYCLVSTRQGPRCLKGWTQCMYDARPGSKGCVLPMKDNCKRCTRQLLRNNLLKWNSIYMYQLKTPLIWPWFKVWKRAFTKLNKVVLLNFSPAGGFYYYSARALFEVKCRALWIITQLNCLTYLNFIIYSILFSYLSR